MNRMFCTECGNKMEYSYSKPKFCSSCGSSCSGLPAKKSLKSKEEAPIEESLSEDETSIDELPDVSKIDVELENYANNVFTFGSLAGEEVSPPSRRRKGSMDLESFIDAKRT
jgi:hypothetical protein